MPATPALEITPRLQAYYDLPLWTEYLAALDRWEQAHASYGRGGGDCANNHSLYIALRNAETQKDFLLERLRKTPEHLAAFGW